VRFPARLYAYSTLALALAGGFLVVATFAFAHSTANDVAIGVAAVITVAAAATCSLRVDRLLRAAALATCLVGAWTFLVALGVFRDATQRWVTFASALAIVAITVAAQVVNVHDSEPPAVRRVAETKAA
jgi:hypothetical protein